MFVKQCKPYRILKRCYLDAICLSLGQLSESVYTSPFLRTVSRGVEARFTQLLFLYWLFHMMKILTTKLWNSAIFLCKWYTLGHQWEKFLFLCILLHMVREIRERRWGKLYYAEFQKKKKNSRNMTMKRNSNYLSYFFLHQQFLWEKIYISREKVFEELFPTSQVLKF